MEIPTFIFSSYQLTVLAIFVVLLLLALFLIGFRQGREISFWPPKIGPKISSDQNEKEIQQPVNPLADLVEIDGLQNAIKKFAELSASSSRIEALVICTDQIAEFIRKQRESFFIGKEFTFLVLDDQGEGISEREKEIQCMGSREGSDYDIRGAIRGKLEDLKNMGGPAKTALNIKRYDMFPFLEIWFFDNQFAVFGLVSRTCSTSEQTFLFCKSDSQLFLWLRRYYDRIDTISHPDKEFAISMPNKSVNLSAKKA